MDILLAHAFKYNLLVDRAPNLFGQEKGIERCIFQIKTDWYDQNYQRDHSDRDSEHLKQPC